MSKTLIGHNNVLFLINDSCQEIKVHCENLNLVKDPSLSRYNFKNFFMFVYPNKTLIYKDELPDEYIVKYRPALQIYKNKLKDNIIDLYEILKNEENVYYKTDTHINHKGNYIVYKYFIQFLNSILNMNLKPKQLELNLKKCELTSLCIGIGDLTWKTNLGEQLLTQEQLYDNYYFNDEITWFYPYYIIRDEKHIRFLDYHLVERTSELENKTVDWNIIGKYIIHIKNTDKIPLKVLFFYDSFLLHILPLYFDLFDEVYFIKTVYSNELINLIKPDYVFEFRVERFLF
jgi:hypothetical protein